MGLAAEISITGFLLVYVCVCEFCASVFVRVCACACVYLRVRACVCICALSVQSPHPLLL